MLVRRALTHACMFGSFTAYWTAVAYELVDHHHLTQNGVAVFALVGAAGAATAPVAGRPGDARHSFRARIVALVVAIVAMGLAGFGASNLVLLALAGVLLDFAVQSHQVLSLRDINAVHGARPRARRCDFRRTAYAGSRTRRGTRPAVG